MKRHNFFLPEKIMEELKVVAEKRHTTVSEIIRQALVDYLDGRRTTTDTAATGA
jgi:metal-responsive CopG/Arc/MetJ family transcriptional regulator